MRHLVLLRGTPACGKSFWLKKNKLEQYSICPDDIRIMFQTPVSDIYGVEGISQKNDKEVWQFVFQLLEQRMKRGEFTIIDATHSRSKLINRYRELCKKYRYRCTVINFELPIKQILKQNKKRDKYKYVPEEYIEMVYERLKTDNIPSWCNAIKTEEYKKIEDILFDFSNYKKIIVIGDMHSSVTVLKEYFLKNKFNNKNFYIFVGDYFDRGIETVETFKYLKDLQQNKNCLFLTGNHEKNLLDYVNEEEVKSKQTVKSIEELNEAGIDRKQIKEFTQRLAQVAYFKYYDKVFVVTHGGIPNIPTIYTATQDYIKGIGKYADSDVVDNTFCKLTPENYYSIHGHRNVYKEKLQNTEKTFNLTDEIEFGGNLRILEITQKRFKKIEIKNEIYNKELKKPISTKKELLKLSSNEIINNLNKDKNIIKKDLGNNIYAYNFSRKVFNKRIWYENTTKARGLFIDIEKEKIVARSYDKFFNWSERIETKTQNLRQTIKSPIYAYEKYNGYLGLLSVYNNEWFIASKTSINGDYALWFKNLIESQLTDKLKSYIKENNVTFVFEVVDIQNDPHIIKYNNSFVVLLDIIYNEFEYKKIEFNELKKIACDFGFHCKKLAHIFNTFEDLYRFRKEQQKKDRTIEDIEGYVFCDSNNFQVKFKSNYYVFWKSIRKIKDWIIRKEGDNTEIRNKLHTKVEFEVYNYMISVPLDKLKNMSIIDIRSGYESKRS